MSDDDIDSFAKMRPLLRENIKDLKDAVKDLHISVIDLDKQVALINQKLLIYTSGGALVVGILVKIAENQLG